MSSTDEELSEDARNGKDVGRWRLEGTSATLQAATGHSLPSKADTPAAPIIASKSQGRNDRQLST